MTRVFCWGLPFPSAPAELFPRRAGLGLSAAGVKMAPPENMPGFVWYLTVFPFGLVLCLVHLPNSEFYKEYVLNAGGQD